MSMKAFLLIAALAVPAPVLGQAWGSIDMSLPMMNSQFILSQQIVSMSSPTLESGSYDGSTDFESAAPEAASLLIPPGAGSGARNLAAKYQTDSRAAAQGLFEDLLAAFGDLMRQLNVAPNDMAGATAVFVGGSYSARNDRTLTEGEFDALVRQMRAALDGNAAYGAAGLAERRDAFEQLAILGMMAAGVQLGLANDPGHPNAARIRSNMRSAGDDYLRGFLGVDPERVTINAAGLRID